MTSCAPATGWPFDHGTGSIACARGTWKTTSTSSTMSSIAPTASRKIACSTTIRSNNGGSGAESRSIRKTILGQGLDDLETDAATNSKIATVADWERKRAEVRKTLRWALGDEPPGVTNPGPKHFRNGGVGENSFGSFLQRPPATKKMGMAAIAPYNGFGDQLFGYLYYPINEEGSLRRDKTPVVIYLHEFDYSKGFNSYHQVDSLFQNIAAEGYAVFAYDMLGFGNRIEEGTRFYDRYPHWSKMGKMIVDVRGAVESLHNMEGIDPNRIFVAGYSLGATVGLYAAALDERIAGVISVAGFTPMRLSTPEKGIEGNPGVFAPSRTVAAAGLLCRQRGTRPLRLSRGAGMRRSAAGAGHCARHGQGRRRRRRATLRRRGAEDLSPVRARPDGLIAAFRSRRLQPVLARNAREGVPMAAGPSGGTPLIQEPKKECQAGVAWSTGPPISRGCRPSGRGL